MTGARTRPVKTRKVADYRGFSILATDYPLETVGAAGDGTAIKEGDFAYLIPGLMARPGEPSLASLTECARYIDEYLESPPERIEDGRVKETFDTEVIARGYSMVVTITKAARRLGLEAHSPVRVTIERIDGERRERRRLQIA